VKKNNSGSWSFDGVVLCLERRKTGDTIEWWRVIKVEMIFLYQWMMGVRRSEKGSLRWGKDLILPFQLERGGDRTNHCRKMKCKQ
jgi:hypothetical protein